MAYAIGDNGFPLKPELIVHDPKRADNSVRRYTFVATYIGSTEDDGTGNTVGLGPYTVGWSATAIGDQYSKKRGVTIARGRSIYPSYSKLGEWATVGNSDELIHSFDQIASAVEELLKVRGQR